MLTIGDSIITSALAALLPPRFWEQILLGNSVRVFFFCSSKGIKFVTGRPKQPHRLDIVQADGAGQVNLALDDLRSSARYDVQLSFVFFSRTQGGRPVVHLVYIVRLLRHSRKTARLRLVNRTNVALRASHRQQLAKRRGI